MRTPPPDESANLTRVRKMLLDRLVDETDSDTIYALTNAYEVLLKRDKIPQSNAKKKNRVKS
jgi:hypothetical protein